MKRLLFAALFVATLGLTWHAMSAWSGGDWRGVLHLLGAVPAPTWALLAALTTGFYVLDWLRFRSLLAVLGYPLRPLQGLRLTCVSYFVTCLTPSAELHTPAMVYVMTRQGIPAPDALATSLLKSIYMTLWICAVSAVCLLSNQSIVLNDLLRQSLPVLALPLLAIAAVLAMMAVFPAAIDRWARRAARRWRPESVAHATVLGIGRTAASISSIGTSGHRQHAVCHVASITFLCTYVAIGWVLAGALGFTLSPVQALTVFSTSLMVAYLAPVPGGIGVTEAATAYLLDPQLGAPAMAVAVALRTLCWYLVALPGGLVLLDSFRLDGGRARLASVFKPSASSDD
jgi:uncharacterized protein (TIRG00374 family)